MSNKSYTIAEINRLCVMCEIEPIVDEMLQKLNDNRNMSIDEIGKILEENNLSKRHYKNLSLMRLVYIDNLMYTIRKYRTENDELVKVINI